MLDAYVMITSALQRKGAGRQGGGICPPNSTCLCGLGLGGFGVTESACNSEFHQPIIIGAVFEFAAKPSQTMNNTRELILITFNTRNISRSLRCTMISKRITRLSYANASWKVIDNETHTTRPHSAPNSNQACFHFTFYSMSAPRTVGCLTQLESRFPFWTRASPTFHWLI